MDRARLCPRDRLFVVGRRGGPPSRHREARRVDAAGVSVSTSPDSRKRHSRGRNGDHRLFYAFYLAAQFSGAGIVLQQTFGIEPRLGVAIGAVIIILYTMLGGFLAVAWTDLVQAILMVATLIVLPIVAGVQLVSRDPSALEAVSASSLSWTGGATGVAAVAAIVSGLSWGFGYTGQPHTITRFMAIDRPEAIRVGRFVAMVWAIPAFAGAMAIGLIGARLYSVEAIPSAESPDVQQLMPFMAMELLPDWLAGIFISGAVAAMMSTADSQLLVGTSAVVEDTLHKGFGLSLSDRQWMWLSRGTTLALGTFGYILASTSSDLIFQLVSYAWSGLGASFGPAVLFTLHWKRTTGAGVLAGMVVGALVTVGWEMLPINELLHARLVSFVLACVTIVVVSTRSAKDSRQA
ncbi:MAG: sodium/proline symporter [Myxococcales bacterium]|nr:sodium/proline symporter [Myxococcales bacterium]